MQSGTDFYKLSFVHFLYILLCIYVRMHISDLGSRLTVDSTISDRCYGDVSEIKWDWMEYDVCACMRPHCVSTNRDNSMGGSSMGLNMLLRNGTNVFSFKCLRVRKLGCYIICITIFIHIFTYVRNVTQDSYTIILKNIFCTTSLSFERHCFYYIVKIYLYNWKK